MVKKKTVDGWGLPTINYELAEDGDTVVKVFCALCQEYYGTRQTGGPYVVGHKGAISSLADKWVSGTTVIKKNKKNYVCTTHFLVCLKNDLFHTLFLFTMFKY